MALFLKAFLPLSITWLGPTQLAVQLAPTCMMVKLNFPFKELGEEINDISKIWLGVYLGSLVPGLNTAPVVLRHERENPSGRPAIDVSAKE